MKTYEEKPVVEVVSQFTDLTGPHGNKDKPYYTGLCPLHDDERVGSFLVFPSSNKVICYACAPSYMTPIEFVMRAINGISYEEAEKIAADQLTAEEAMAREIKKNRGELKLDLATYSARGHKLFDVLDYTDALNVLKQMDQMLDAGRWAAASAILSGAGV